MGRAARVLLTISLFVGAGFFCVLAYLREGEDVFESLPLLASSDAWRSASPELFIIAAIGAMLFFTLCGRSASAIIENRMPCIAAVSLYAALAADAYDTCARTGLSWLPQIGGCHCWVTTAAVVLAALVATAVIFVLGLFTFRIYRACVAIFAIFLRHQTFQHILLLRRAPAIARRATVVIRLIAFRGPPFFGARTAHA